jgi:LytR cell envelope-related transcriptional attenuator
MAASAPPTPTQPAPKVRASRRPIPAMIFLLVLALISTIVWWRVLGRSTAATKATTTTSTSTSTGAACPKTTKRLSLPKPTAVHVAVHNGTQRNGLASQVSTKLRARGFVISGFDTGTAYSGVAQIQFGSAALAAASVLAYQFPGAALVPITRTGTALDLTLGAQYKSLATAAVVKAKTAAAKSAC